jgi:hypothetical protein
MKMQKKTQPFFSFSFWKGWEGKRLEKIGIPELLRPHDHAGRTCAFTPSVVFL